MPETVALPYLTARIFSTWMLMTTCCRTQLNHKLSSYKKQVSMLCMVIGYEDFTRLMAQATLVNWRSPVTKKIF